MGRRVLVVSYYFPPAGGGGVQRVLKWVKYLPELGWEVMVVCADNKGVVPDPALAAELPREVRVVRVAGPGGAVAGAGGHSGIVQRLRPLAFPDTQAAWWPRAVPALRALARAWGPGVVLASGPPFSVFVPALAAARAGGCPLVIDFRDEWRGFYAAGYNPLAAGALRRAMVGALERAVVRQAGRVVVASPAYSRRLRRLYGGPRGKYVWIPNGYDPPDFPDPPPPAPRWEGRIVISYVGTVFEVTSLEYLLRGLGLLGREVLRRLELRVVGRVVDRRFISPLPEGLRLRLVGPLEHPRAVAQMLSAHVLVLTLAPMPGAERVIPAKTYEYLAARRPVLGVLPPGECAKIIATLKAGEVLHPLNPWQIAAAVGRWLVNPPPPPPPPPPGFSRPRLAHRLSRVLEQLVEA